MNIALALRAALALPLIALALSACTNKLVPPCPSVRVDSTTGRLTQFKEGGGRTAADAAYQAEVVAYQGQCNYGDDGVTVSMDLDFRIATGPAVEKGPADVYYFVAVPQLFPDARAKRIFKLKYDLPGAPGVQDKVRENNLRIFIPLKKEEFGAAYDIYVGLQLDSAQLDYNRSQRQ